MSGGAFDYGYTYLDRYENELGDEKVKELLKDFRALLHDVEWWNSGDICEEDYKKSLEEFKKKWGIK